MIAILAPYYLPAVEPGGPIKSIKGVCSILHGKIPYKVITWNRNIRQKPFEKREWSTHAEYVPRITIRVLWKNFKKAKVIWLNSPYSIQFAFLPLLVLLFFKNKKVLVSPRGQLLYGAISTKKKLYLYVFRFLLRISRNTTIIHYTHSDEQSRSYPIFRDFKQIVFLNPINEIENTLHKGKNVVKPIIGFFGRVVPKKNIDFIISILPLLDNKCTFQIHGYIEDQWYKKKCESLAKKLGVYDRVKFYGTFTPNDFQEKIAPMKVVAIPSLSENFCHVFFEAIEVDKMTVVSTGLPWKDANDFEPNTVLPLQENFWVKRINEIMKYDEKTYAAHQIRLKEYYRQTQATIKKENLKHFTELVEQA